jgi:hypothetical protein
MMTGWKHLSQLLKERPSLYLMALSSLLIALPEAMFAYFYLLTVLLAMQLIPIYRKTGLL